MKIKVRRANVEDLTFLLRLEKEAFPYFQQNSKQSLKNGINSHFQEVLIFAHPQKRKTAVGSAVLYKYRNTLRIYSIALLPEYQNMGFGSMMIDYIREYAGKNNFGKGIYQQSAISKHFRFQDF